MNRFGVLLLFILPAIQSPASATTNDTLWQEAAESYDRGDYSSAVEKYNRILERGFSGPELYYNLGNSYFKSGKLGASIWAYRRALKLDPDLKQVKANLQYVRGLNADKIEGKEGGFILDIWDFLTGLFTSNGYLILFTAAWWITGLVAGLMILKPGTRSLAYYLLIVSLVIAIFAAAASARRIKLDRLTTWGVLTAQAADIREGPGADFQKIEIGHEGLEFKILGEREGSYLIELGNNLRGWVEKEAVLII